MERQSRELIVVGNPDHSAGIKEQRSVHLFLIAPGSICPNVIAPFRIRRFGEVDTRCDLDRALEPTDQGMPLATILRPVSLIICFTHSAEDDLSSLNVHPFSLESSVEPNLG